MSTSLNLRAATPADIPAIIALLEQLTRVEGGRSQNTPALLSEALFGQTCGVALRACVVVAGDQPIAVALYYPGYDVLSASYGYHLADFVVAETHRRQAMGRRLFAHLARQNLDEGGEWISLTAIKTNQAARAFYAKLGMTQVAVDFFAIGPAALAALS